jgi:hypothetical protein
MHARELYTWHIMGAPYFLYMFYVRTCVCVCVCGVQVPSRGAYVLCATNKYSIRYGAAWRRYILLITRWASTVQYVRKSPRYSIALCTYRPASVHDASDEIILITSSTFISMCTCTTYICRRPDIADLEMDRFARIMQHVHANSTRLGSSLDVTAPKSVSTNFKSP